MTFSLFTAKTVTAFHFHLPKTTAVMPVRHNDCSSLLFFPHFKKQIGIDRLPVGGESAFPDIDAQVQVGGKLARRSFGAVSAVPDIPDHLSFFHLGAGFDPIGVSGQVGIVK